MAPIKAIGISLLTTYSLAFELISLALLVAIVGALRHRPHRKDQGHDQRLLNPALAPR